MYPGAHQGGDDVAQSRNGLEQTQSYRAEPGGNTLGHQGGGGTEHAADAKTDEKTIRTLHELQERQDREKLIEAMPEIKFTFNGFGENGCEHSIEQLPIVAQHQLGVKLIDSLNKAKDQVLMRVMRSRRITDLASIPLLEDGINQMTEWVHEFENLHSTTIGEAIEQGANIRTLDDMRA